MVILRLLGILLLLDKGTELRHGHLGRLLARIVEPTYEIAELLDVKPTLLFFLLLSLHLLKLLLLAGEHAVALQFLVEFLQ